MFLPQARINPDSNRKGQITSLLLVAPNLFDQTSKKEEEEEEREREHSSAGVFIREGPKIGSGPILLGRGGGLKEQGGKKEPSFNTDIRGKTGDSIPFPLSKVGVSKEGKRAAPDQSSSLVAGLEIERGVKGGGSKNDNRGAARA